MASSTKTSVILDSPSDWHEWLFIIRSRARHNNIEQLINPDLTVEPSWPTEPTMPTPQDVKPGAAGVSELDSKQLELYKLLRHDYQLSSVKYERKIAALGEIEALITTTITRSNLSFILKKTTPWQMLSALKLRLAPTDRVRQIDVLRQYQELRNPPRSQGIDIWLQRWEKVYTEAVELALPDVQGDRSVYDFIFAIKVLDSTFASTHEILLDERITDGKPIPSVFELIAKFRNHQRLNVATEKMSSHSAFATFNNERQQNEPWTKPCVCGEIHPFRACPYLIKQIRTSDWVPDPVIQQKIDRTLSKIDTLREAVEYAQKRAQNNTKSPHTESTVSRGRSTSREQKNDEIEICTPHVARTSSSASFTMGAFAVAHTYKLHNSWTLDCATNTHVCNDSKRFKFNRKATIDDTLYAGKDIYKIEAFGSVKLAINTPFGKRTIRLLDIALVPGFHTNLAALSRFTKKGVHWDSEKQRLHRNSETFCYTQAVDNHWVLEYHPLAAAAPAPSSEPSAVHSESSAIADGNISSTPCSELIHEPYSDPTHDVPAADASVDKLHLPLKALTNQKNLPKKKNLSPGPQADFQHKMTVCAAFGASIKTKKNDTEILDFRGKLGLNRKSGCG